SPPRAQRSTLFPYTPLFRSVLERAGLEPLSIRNSPPVPGDPYLGLGTPGELVFGLVKRVIFGAALAIAFASVHRWLVGPSLEARSEEHTSELQSLRHLVCRL